MKGDLKIPFIDGIAETNFPAERAGNIEHLRDWLSYQPHLPELSDEFLHLFLHSCHDNLERSKKTVESYFTMKTMTPELFSNRDPLGNDVQLSLDITEMVLLPKVTPEGYMVVMYRLSDFAASKFVFSSMIKTFFMVNDLLLSEAGMAPGCITIFDMKGFSLAHLARISVPIISKLMFYIQECHPVRLKGIHIINTVPFMDRLLSIAKPFMHSELIQMLHMHGPVESILDVVPVEILPEDYNGKAQPLSELHATTRRLLEGRYVDWFAQEEKLRTDESKRTGKSPVVDTLFGVEGSFRKLDID